jgi:plastocyanin
MRTRLVLPVLLLALAACSSGDAPGDAIGVSVADFMIDPTEVEVAGPTVTIDVTNDGPTPHNLTVRDADGDVVMGTEDLSPGDAETISAELEPGEYVIFCSLAGHESLGMSGSLVVTAP